MKQESFLPEGYKEPSNNPYMKFTAGSNRFRILGPAKVGYEYWTRKTIDGIEKDVPIKVTKEESIPLAEVITDKYGKIAIYYFWAFPVYNFNEERIQILQIKQKSVREGMQKSLGNKMWGNAVPGEYTFDVNQGKKADGKPEYSVIPEPKEELDKSIVEKFNSMNIDMDVWMAGKDPFVVTGKSTSEEIEMPSF